MQSNDLTTTLLSTSAKYDKSPTTRKICYWGLRSTWVVGIVLTVTGLGLLFSQGADGGGYVGTNCQRSVRQILPLIVNIFVTIVTESTGLIHSTSLRWALGRKLNFNSNLRLFTHVPERLGFGRFSNLLNALFLILSYASTTAIFSTTPIQAVCDKIPYASKDCDDGGSEQVLNISPLAVVVLGLGLTGQAITATLQIRRVQIPTWSSSPLDNAWASLSVYDRNPGRCMMSVHDLGKPTVPVRPRHFQRSAWTAHPEVRRIFIFIWILIVVIAAWCAALFGSIRHIDNICEENPDKDICGGIVWGTSWSPFPDTNGISTLLQIDAVNEPLADLNIYARGFFITFAIQITLQAVLTMCLHCVELLVTTSRDEDSWRKACSNTGYRNSNAIITAVKSWKSIALLISKPIVHWLFGLSIEFYYSYGIFMRPVQIFYMLVAMILVALFATFLCFKKPKGPQPATFGHIQTLIDLIDVWGEPLYWGDKGNGPFDTRNAGTTVSERPKEIIMDQLYGGSSEDGLRSRQKLHPKVGQTCIGESSSTIELW